MGTLKTILKAISATTILSVAVAAVFYIGYETGRKQYHNELLNELEAKGGAPILVYPPSPVINYPEGY